jgi:hypothetical protein
VDQYLFTRVGAPEDEGRAIPRNAVVKNKETMEKVQNLKSSNTALSSKIFRDEILGIQERQKRENIM